MKIGNDKGFTLLELIIVVGILAALVGLAAPYYRDYVSESKNAIMRSNLHTLKKGLMDHFADLGHYPARLEIMNSTHTYFMEIPIDPEDGAIASWGYSAPLPALDSYSLNSKYQGL